MAECKSLRTDDSKCRAQALRGGGQCFFHGSDSRTRMIEAARSRRRAADSGTAGKRPLRRGRAGSYAADFDFPKTSSR